MTTTGLSQQAYVREKEQMQAHVKHSICCARELGLHRRKGNFKKQVLCICITKTSKLPKCASKLINGGALCH